MRVSEAMTRDVRVAHPNQNLMDAARMMAECDCGVLPVGENDRMIGMITDRDIVVRALAIGKDGDTMIREVMSPEIKYCYEDDDVSDAARSMGELQIRRLPVVTRDKRLIGILSLGDIANADETQPAAQALSSISEPSSQSGEASQRPH